MNGSAVSPRWATPTCVVSWSLRHAAFKPDTTRPWLARLLREKPRKVAAVALANKTARIVLAVLARDEAYPSAA